MDKYGTPRYPEVLLETKGLTKSFGGLAAVSELDMHVNQGEIVGLIGPNGAGKTTTFNLMTGILRPTGGKIIFEGRNITGKKPHSIAKMGIGRTFQLASLFGDFTVLENVVASFYLYPKSGFWEAMFNISTYRKKEEYILDQAKEILRFVGLDAIGDEFAKNLPHGHQKILGVARTLAIKPKLLLLDEPIAGMTHNEIEFSLGAFEKMRSEGMTILLVEHNMEIMSLCDRIIVLNFGHKIAEGLPGEIRQNEDVNQAYFGSQYAA
ncbi:MAG: ABC transporter ATP-binding protein [Desulfobacteraceae bacterium]|nr:ABC transporter ATP-binding protein [Desulfobacteraceae bacterium]